MHSIRFKITVITIAAILTTVLCVFLASYGTLAVENDRNSVGTLNLIAQDTQKSLEKYTESIEQSMEMINNIAVDSLDSVTLAENGVIGTHVKRGRSPEQVERLNKYLSDYCARLQETFSGVASHTHGVIAYYYCISPEISETEHGFYYSRVGKTGFDRQQPLDARTLDPQDMQHNTWYFTPIQRGRPSWVGPYTEAAAEELWRFSYIVPVYKSGTFIGVIGMDIPVETLVEQVRAIRVYQTGFASLLDADSRVLYHPERPFRSLMAAAELGINDEAIRQQRSGDAMIRYAMDGEKRQLSFCTMSNGMKLVVIAPVSEINASWTRLARNNLVITLAIIVVFAVLIMLVMRYMTSPLRTLTAASQRLAESDYDVNLDYNGHDEVGTLTQAFSRMRDQIKRYIDDLNRQLLTDKLTGLPNMRHFFRLAREERKRMQAEGKHPAMLYFNIIGMKHFNRQYGFEEGDRLICQYAEILARLFQGHSVCRFSEDHFAAVVEDEQAEGMLRSLFAACEKAGGEKALPIRVGIYPNSLEEVDVSVACDRAKFASDQNKVIHASGFCRFDEKMLRDGEIYRHIISSVDRALAEGWIDVYYQPIIRASDGKVCDEEALSRWIDPELGFLSPAEFIPALEESRLIYKLDLYMVDRVLEKIKRQSEVGLYVVPQSVNLSRVDFDSCDIVEEIRRRVDEAGVGRSALTIEITESVIASDFDLMKKQILRFQELGFQVWMDDFGSGYSSLDVLQNIHFDLIKFDMRFMERFDSGDESKIILTELTKMAIALGVETVCEGVERIEQVDFLREIGCTRIQGYYYGKPLSFDQILMKYRRGDDMGFENPEESDYFASIGRVNLYDITMLAGGDEESLGRYFDSLPMCIVEVGDGWIKHNRCNKSFREFYERILGMRFSMEKTELSALPDGPVASMRAAMVRCGSDGNRAIVDEKINADTTVHVFLRRVAVNPVTGVAAVAVAVLTVIKASEDGGTNYADIAKALSSDYMYLYYVDLKTDRFIEYRSDAVREDLTMEHHGEDFFGISRRDARKRLHKDDQDYFLSAFSKENIERTLAAHGTFTVTYRLLMNGEPVYVNLKAVRMQDDPTHIIIGVNNVDAQMRQKETITRIQAEEATYSRVEALMPGFVCIYTVDPVTGRYTEYNANAEFAELGLPKEGNDFFAVAQRESARFVHPDDVEKFRSLVTREKMMEGIENHGLHSLRYRMLLSGKEKYVNLKAALVKEKNGPQLIVGVCDIDSQFRRELDYERRLTAARGGASLDALTGIRDRKAFTSMSDEISRQAEKGQSVPCDIVLCRLTDAAQVREAQGAEAGNRLVRDACAAVCGAFKHSPVFRVAEDEFVAVVQGRDLENIDTLIAWLAEKSRQEKMGIACTMASRVGMETLVETLDRTEREG